MPAVRIEFVTGYWISLEALSRVQPWMLAKMVYMDLDEFLVAVDHWSKGPGLPYGVRVDLEQGVINGPV